MKSCCFVIASLEFGGAQRVLTNVVNTYVRNGIDVQILTFMADHPPAFELDPRVRVQHLDLMRASKTFADKIRNNLRRLRILRGAIRSVKSQNVISFMDRTNMLVLFAAFGLRKKIMVSERSHPQQNMPNLGLQLIRFFIYGLSHKIIFQTQAVKSATCVLGKSRAVVISNAVPAISVSNFSERDSKKTIVGMGRLSFEKGFDVLLKAFAIVQKKYPEWKLLIYGKGNQTENLNEIIAKHSLRVEFRGWVEPNVALDSGSIFVLPSRYEGFPNALSEAMAAGLACVSSDCNFGPSELISNGTDGLLFKNENSEALAQALEKLLSNQALRKELASKGQASVQRFQPEAIYAKWLDLIDPQSER